MYSQGLTDNHPFKDGCENRKDQSVEQKDYLRRSNYYNGKGGRGLCVIPVSLRKTGLNCRVLSFSTSIRLPDGTDYKGNKPAENIDYLEHSGPQTL